MRELKINEGLCAQAHTGSFRSCQDLRVASSGRQLAVEREQTRSPSSSQRSGKVSFRVRLWECSSHLFGDNHDSVGYQKRCPQRGKFLRNPRYRKQAVNILHHLLQTANLELSHGQHTIRGVDHMTDINRSIYIIYIVSSVGEGGALAESCPSKRLRPRALRCRSTLHGKRMYRRSAASTSPGFTMLMACTYSSLSRKAAKGSWKRRSPSTAATRGQVASALRTMSSTMLRVGGRARVKHGASLLGSS